MTLTLRIIRNDAPNMGVNPELVLNNRGANIGRALTCEWVLPDDARVVSSKHCEVQFRDNAYFLIDYGSTNGTFVGESRDRLEGTHRIAPGDRFRIGPYVIEARLAGAALQAYETGVESAMAAARGPDFGDWHDVPGGRPAPPPPPPAPGFAEGGGWDLPQAAPERASIWSEDAARGTGAASADDIFGNFTAKNEVDWNNAAWSVEADFDPFRVDPADGGGGGGFAPLPGANTATQPGGGDPFAPMTGAPSGAAGGFDPLPGTPAAPPPAAPATSGAGFAPMSGTPDLFPPASPGGAFAPLPGESAPPAPLPTSPGAFGGGGSSSSGGSFAPLDGGAAQPPFPAAPAAPAQPAATQWPQPPAHEPTMGAWAPAAPDAGPAAPASAAQPVRVRPSPVAHSPAPPMAPEPAGAPSPAAHAPAMAPAMPDAVFAALLGELGVPAAQLKLSPEEAAAKAGRMLRHLIAGLMILLEARARAKEEMGAAGTALSFDGNNPLKFARNVDQALVMMLNPQLRGYMEAEGAIEESYRDLQAHQIATLKAMQGALRETLNRFSPAAIKARTKEQGLLAKVLPGQREAAMWKAYEAQFSGVAEGSAEAFLEVFSREFRKAYEESSQPPRRR